ncbi:MAG: AbrB/MazE/SpoVT family DNA-binding domain-containing protein [Thermoprotei archaeon]
MSEFRARISKKNTLYLPKAVTKALGLSEGSVVKIYVEDNRIIIEPVENPFEYALKCRKYAKTTHEEFERESEEFQREILG